jgi:hypothetical protein
MVFVDRVNNCKGGDEAVLVILRIIAAVGMIVFLLAGVCLSIVAFVLIMRNSILTTLGLLALSSLSLRVSMCFCELFSYADRMYWNKHWARFLGFTKTKA